MLSLWQSWVPSYRSQLLLQDDTHGSAGSSDEEFMLESEWEDGAGSSRLDHSNQRSLRASQRALLRYRPHAR